MNNKEFQPILEKFITEMRRMESTKGADYTIGNDDRLNNFKNIGELVCCSNCQKPVGPRAVWAIYAMKHLLAILAWVKTGKVESEGLFGRFLDLAVYSPLGYAISQEQQEKNTETEIYLNPEDVNKLQKQLNNLYNKEVNNFCSLKNHGINNEKST